MTTALYRRYRPESFAEVIGQEHVTEPLMQALRSDKVTHAYLFSGPRGCGKTTSARILARCLNCAEGPTDTPCGTCASCRELARDGAGSLDVVEIDAASHGGVDDARDLRERATFAPARDRFKIFILDEAHMVTSQGFNALLKIVEEPPPHVKFVFATTEPDKVIGTIRSRTHHYPFRLVAPDTLLPYLEQLCAAEGVGVGAGVLPLVVRAGGGSVRDSLSVLDQLVAGADEGGLDYERAVALLGYTHAALLDDVVDAVAARDGASAFRVVERVVASGHEPRRFVEDLLERLRDLIVIAASGEAAQAVLRDLPSDQLERMRGQAGALGAAELSRSADLVNEALTEMTGATSPRLHLELLVARLLLPGADDGARGLGARVDRVERQLAGGVVPAPATGTGRAAAGGAPSAAVPAAAPAAAPAPAAGSGAPAAAAPAADAPSAPQPTAPQPTAPQVSSESGPAGAPSGAAGEATSAGRPAPAGETEAVSSSPGGPADAAPDDPSSADAAPGGTPVAAPAVDPAGAAPVVAVVPAPGGGLDAETVRRRWPEVLQTLRGLRMATWVLVSQNAHVGEVSAEVLVLAFSTPQLATTFRQGPHADNVRRALHETLGLDVRVEAGLGTGSAPAASATPPVPTTEKARPTRSEGTMSSAEAEASWSVTPAARPAGPSAAAGAAGPTAGRRGPSSPSSGDGGQGRAAGGPVAPPSRAPEQARGSGPSDDDPPWDMEPPPEDDPGPPPPPRDAPAQRSGGASRPPGLRVAPGTRPHVRERRPAPSRVDEDDTSPDDPDVTASGLVGAPLVAQMLGGTVIDEIPEDEAPR